MATHKPSVTNEVLAIKLDAQNSDIVEIKGTLKSVATTLAAVGRIEDRQITLMDKMSDADKRHEKMDERLTVVERDMPGLRELRKWVVVGLVGSIGISSANFMTAKPTYITVESKQVPQLSQVPQLPQSKP